MEKTLPPKLAEFVRSQVESGQYRSPQEVVEDALRLLLARHEQREAKRVAVREALERGERSPLVENYSIDALIAERSYRAAE